MPLYNAAPFLAQALESIRAQTWPVQEVLVVDDGSTDGSAGIAASFPFVTLIRKEHSGISPTLNRGLDSATGDYLAFLDADDRWMPDKNRLQLTALFAEPGLDMVFGAVRRFRSSETEDKQAEVPLDIVPGLCKDCMLIRRSSFEKVGGFATEAGAHDFLDWYGRAKEASLCSLMLNEVVAERRIHDDNYGLQNKGAQRQSYFTTLKTILDRKRAAQNRTTTENR